MSWKVVVAQQWSTHLVIKRLWVQITLGAGLSILNSESLTKVPRRGATQLVVLYEWTLSCAAGGKTRSIAKAYCFRELEEIETTRLERWLCHKTPRWITVKNIFCKYGKSYQWLFICCTCEHRFHFRGKNTSLRHPWIICTNILEIGPPGVLTWTFHLGLT